MGGTVWTNTGKPDGLGEVLGRQAGRRGDLASDFLLCAITHSLSSTVYRTHVFSLTPFYREENGGSEGYLSEVPRLLVWSPADNQRKGVVCKSYFVCKTLPFYIPCNGPGNSMVTKCPSSKWGWGRCRAGGWGKKQRKEFTFFNDPLPCHIPRQGGWKSEHLNPPDVNFPAGWVLKGGLEYQIDWSHSGHS